MKKHTLIVPLLTLALAVSALTSCASTNVSRLLSNPEKYQNRTVRVYGRVDNSYGVPFAGGVYQVDDGTGKIYVLSARGKTPSKGAQVNVAGTLTSGITVGGKSYGTIIREQSLHVH
jgi:hypothetical protein